jgi:hypothetical protein
MTIAVATLGMRLEPYHHFLLRPFSAHNVTTLSHLSARLPLDTPEPYTPDGTHVRCFGCAFFSSSFVVRFFCVSLTLSLAGGGVGGRLPVVG